MDSPFFSTSSLSFFLQVFLFPLFFRNSLAIIEKNFRRGEMGERFLFFLKIVFQVEPVLYLFFIYDWEERKGGQTPFVFIGGWVPKLTLSEREGNGKGRDSEVNLIGKRRKGS